MARKSKKRIGLEAPVPLEDLLKIEAEGLMLVNGGFGFFCGQYKELGTLVDFDNKKIEMTDQTKDVSIGFDRLERIEDLVALLEKLKNQITKSEK